MVVGCVLTWKFSSRHPLMAVVRCKHFIPSDSSLCDRVQILTCQHCRTTVAVVADFICPCCRKPTTNVPLPIDEEMLVPMLSNESYRSDVIMNRIFMIASFICAGMQIVSLIRHSVTRHLAVAGGNSLEHLAGFAEIFDTISVSLSLQVLGSAFGLGAGNLKLSCIVCNIVCCVFCILISLRV